MSNSNEMTERERLESKYFKWDLTYFFIVLGVLLVILAAVAIWDNKAGVLAPFTTKLLETLKIQF